MQKESRNNYYIPAEDSIFFADYLKDKKGRSALDIGTGSGILANVLSKNFSLVVATDVNISALVKAHETLDNCICCNAADTLHTRFDLVVCNLPYLPSDELLDPAVDGLHDGTEIPSIIIKSASSRIEKNGKMVFLTSSLAKYDTLVQLAESLGFHVTIVAKKKLFYEELIIIECTKNQALI
ncbi:MAG TPA: HemK2/MTQ2 family protein methyltransferase [Candidatus Nitrosotalea sp.]|nr:HemK2/MTQ2 family protein methyltransferase [Candidatus Nitrosotalea sp.]